MVANTRIKRSYLIGWVDSGVIWKPSCSQRQDGVGRVCVSTFFVSRYILVFGTWKLYYVIVMQWITWWGLLLLFVLCLFSPPPTHPGLRQFLIFVFSFHLTSEVFTQPSLLGQHLYRSLMYQQSHVYLRFVSPLLRLRTLAPSCPQFFFCTATTLCVLRYSQSEVPLCHSGATGRHVDLTPSAVFFLIPCLQKIPGPGGGSAVMYRLQHLTFIL